MASIQETYQEDGYVVVRGLFDPKEDLQPLNDAYTRLLDALAQVYLLESYPEGLENFDSMSLQERFAYMLGASAGTALHHLDPVLNVFVDTYRWRKDLPVTQIPEMFDLMRHEKILDVLEQLIGSEIFASPVWHINMKLAPQHLKLADEVAASSSRDMSDETFYTFQVGKTGWHMDAITGMPDSRESQIANAWIPMTHARKENGCLLVIPGSHKGGVRKAPFPDEMVDRAVPLIMDPGDVVILDNKLVHGATQNTSEADYRWAFNFRYLPTGQPSGRTFLPGFVARSRSAPETELRNPFLWGMMWYRVLEYISENGLPEQFSGPSTTSLEAAVEITREWEEKAPDVNGWLQLEESVA
ncbi:MAG: phytanoyl-CoA dioxygenase family protein [bacterium]|nr:phytanoyl-CoA dioxygenase family protein [bacterium]